MTDKQEDDDDYGAELDALDAKQETKKIEQKQTSMFAKAAANVQKMETEE